MIDRKNKENTSWNLRKIPSWY